MKVIVGTKVFDSDKEPILLKLDSTEKWNILCMGLTEYFMSVPDGTDEKEASYLMQELIKQLEMLGAKETDEANAGANIPS